MVRCFHETVFSKVSVPFKQAVVVKPCFPVAVVYIEYGFVVFLYGAKVEGSLEM